MYTVAGGAKPPGKPAVDIHASAAESRKRARGVQPGSFLSLLINSRHQETGATFSDDEATSQAFTFLLAGYETTASALAFTIYSLAKHPEKTEKLIQVSEPVTKEDLLGSEAMQAASLRIVIVSATAIVFCQVIRSASEASFFAVEKSLCMCVAGGGRAWGEPRGGSR